MLFTSRTVLDFFFFFTSTQWFEQKLYFAIDIVYYALYAYNAELYAQKTEWNRWANVGNIKNNSDIFLIKQVNFRVWIAHSRFGEMMKKKIIEKYNAVHWNAKRMSTAQTHTQLFRQTKIYLTPIATNSTHSSISFGSIRVGCLLTFLVKRLQKKKEKETENNIID